MTPLHGAVCEVWDLQSKSVVQSQVDGDISAIVACCVCILEYVCLQHVSIKVPQFNEKYYKYLPVSFAMFEYIFLKYI